jgi:hypothetical protein
MATSNTRLVYVEKVVVLRDITKVVKIALLFLRILTL